MKTNTYAGILIAALICLWSHASWAQAPASMNGLTLLVTITSAGGGDTASGNYTIKFGAKNATIKYQGKTKQRAYTYSVVNASTGEMVSPATDGSGNITTIDIQFTSLTNGTYASTSLNGMYENGTFIVSGGANKFAPASLVNQGLTTQETGSKVNIAFTFGATTFAQTGPNNDTNADDFTAGDYSYVQTSIDTGIITNTDVSFMSNFGNTNTVAIYLTFNSATAGSYKWTNDPSAGTGTFKLAALKKNPAPATLAGKTLTARKTLIAFSNSATFTESKNGTVVGSGNYTYTPFSPTVGVLELNWTDTDNAGAVAYVELTFTSTTKVNIAQSWYANPVFGANPDDWGQATGTIK
jgi:hypothetical protein